MSRITKCFFPPFFIFLLLCTLEYIIIKTNVPNYIIPLPSQVVNAILTDREIILDHTLTTASEWILGIIISILISFILALFAFKSKWINFALSPLLIISQSIPYLVFTPLLMIWLGLGIAPKVVLVTLTCSFPISIVLINGLHEAKNEYHLVVEMLHIKPLKALIHIYFPYTLPNFFDALKISVSYSFGSATLAELMGSEKGLGVYLLRSQATYQTNKVIAAVLIVVIISLLSTACVTLLKKKIVFWKSAKR